MVKLSIVIPIYNVEKYLGECLESVILQSLKDIEIICVNDGSTDKSTAILNEYSKKDNRIKVIYKKNSGYGAAVNAGMRVASGEYIGIVESDDSILHDMYLHLYQAAQETGADIVRTGFYRRNKFYDKDIDIYNDICMGHNEFYGKLVNFADNPLIIETHKCTWCAIYRTNFLKENKIVHNETAGASFQDNGFWFQTILFANSIYNINEPGYRYRMDNLSASSFSKDKEYAMIEEYNYIREKIIERKDYLKYLPAYFWAREMALLNELERVSEKHKLLIARCIKQDLLEMNELEVADLKYWENNDSVMIKLIKIFFSPEQYVYNLISKEEKLYKFINKGKFLFIYGAGVWGKRCLNFLSSFSRIGIPICFMVSDIEAFGEDNVNGIPVIQVDDNRIEKDSARIVVAVAPEKYEEVEKMLYKNEFKVYLAVQDLFDLQN